MSIFIASSAFDFELGAYRQNINFKVVELSKIVLEYYDLSSLLILKNSHAQIFSKMEGLRGLNPPPTPQSAETLSANLPGSLLQRLLGYSFLLFWRRALFVWVVGKQSCIGSGETF